MALLMRAAEALSRHLLTCHPRGELRSCVDLPWQDLQPRIREISQQIATGRWPDAWPDPVLRTTVLPGLQFPEGVLQWAEEWWYPPPDLLARLIEGGHVGPQGGLWLWMRADGRELNLFTALVPYGDWFDPRQMWNQRFAPFYRKTGTSLRELKRLRKSHFASYQQPIVRNGHIAWMTYLSSEMPRAEVLTSLLILAERVGFPVSEKERRTAWNWMRRIMRGAFRYWSLERDSRSQWVDDLAGDVYQALTKRFYWPSTPWGLRTFIQRTAEGLAKDVVKLGRKKCQAEDEWGRDTTDESVCETEEALGGRKRPQGETLGHLEPLVDRISGAPVYPPSVIVYEIFHRHGRKISERTVYRWMRERGCTVAHNGSRALSEEQFAVFEQVQVQKIWRKALMEFLINRKKMSEVAAKQWIYRHWKRGASFQDVARALIHGER